MKRAEENLDRYKLLSTVVLHESKAVWETSHLFLISNTILATVIGTNLLNRAILGNDIIVSLLPVLGLITSTLWAVSYNRTSRYYKFRMDQVKQIEPLNYNIFRGEGERVARGETVNISGTSHNVKILGLNIKSLDIVCWIIATFLIFFAILSLSNSTESINLLIIKTNSLHISTIRIVIAALMGYVIWGFVSNKVTKWYSSRLWEKARPDGFKMRNEYSWIPRDLGIIERFIYTSAIISNQFLLIGLMLTIKAIGDFSDNFYENRKPRKAEEHIPKRIRANIFLNGSLISLILGVTGGIIFKSISERNYLANLLNRLSG